MKRICVYCASSTGARPEYAAAATELGQLIARRGLELVYGGGNIGLMGILAKACMSNGGHVIGVIPEALMSKELGLEELPDLRIVGSMHERKKIMADLSDAFIALPGGFGTLEEFFECLTWTQLGFHAKPFGLVNTSGFYDHLLRFVDHAVEEKLLKAKHRNLLLADSTPKVLLERLLSAHVSYEPKWIDRTER